MSDFKSVPRTGALMRPTSRSAASGNTIDSYISPTRNTSAARRFLAKALADPKDWEKPTIINTDKAPTYAAALAALASGQPLPPCREDVIEA
jgi:transposase-like protein